MLHLLINLKFSHLTSLHGVLSICRPTNFSMFKGDGLAVVSGDELTKVGPL